METPRSLAATGLIILELLVLLILPLPFLHLNVIYVIAAIAITVSVKFVRKEQWSDYGFKKVRMTTVLLASAIGIAFGFADNYLIEPFMTKLLGAAPDLSTFDDVKGNVSGLITFLVLGWVVGGFFEEFFFRGYLFHRISTLIKNPVWFKIIAITITSIVFAFAHNYQGMAGIIGTAYFAVILGILYFYFNRNIWYLVLIHGFFDTVGIVKLYLG